MRFLLPSVVVAAVSAWAVLAPARAECTMIPFFQDYPEGRGLNMWIVITSGGSSLVGPIDPRHPERGTTIIPWLKGNDWAVDHPEIPYRTPNCKELPAERFPGEYNKLIWPPHGAAE
jgi:hypothetical protein